MRFVLNLRIKNLNLKIDAYSLFCFIGFGMFYLIINIFSVERRRRFNINDRIKELGTLLPKNNDP